MKFMRLALAVGIGDHLFHDFFLQGRGEGAGAGMAPLAPDPLLELHCSSLLMTSLVPSIKALQLFQYLTCMLYLYFYRPHKTLDNNGEISIGREKKVIVLVEPMDCLVKMVFQHEV